MFVLNVPRKWFVFGAFLGWIFSTPISAQQVPTDSLAQSVRQQKATYYTQIEYQRCRSDVIELLEKGDVTEQRVKNLEEEVRKLTDELAAVKGKPSEKPAN